jgi:quinol monooxygenase YgiN
MKTMLNVMLSFLMLAGVALQGVYAQGQPAVEAPQGPAHVVTYIEVSPNMSGKATALLRMARAAARKAPGVLRYDILQRRERPNHFAIVEAWQDTAARDVNLSAAHTKKLRDDLQPLLVAAYDERPHSGLDVGPASAAAGAKGAAVFTVTHVDFIPPKKDDGIAAIRQLASPSRQDAGNLRYDVLQQSSRPNHLTLVETWRDHKALEAHETAAHTVKFRDALLPMSGSLFDQRLYRAIE